MDNGPHRDVTPAPTPAHKKPKPESFNEAMNPPNSPKPAEKDQVSQNDYWDRSDAYHEK